MCDDNNEIESQNSEISNFSDQTTREVIENIKKRCRTPTNKKANITFCNVPSSSKVSRSQTSTMTTFRRSLRTPSFYNQNVSYRNREKIEEKQQKKFDEMIQNKYYCNAIYSPYKIDLCQLREETIRKNRISQEKREMNERRERFISTKNYLKEAEESISHDKQLVQNDYFVFWDKSLRILAV